MKPLRKGKLDLHKRGNIISPEKQKGKMRPLRKGKPELQK